MCWLTGCAGSSKKENYIKPVEPYKITFNLERLSDKNAPMMSDIIDSLEYIKLEYNPKFPIGFILDGFRPYITNDYIFISCSHESGLLQYKRNGEFVSKIGSFGRGPGEYLQLLAVVIDEKKGIIYIIPNTKRVIDKYDYTSGKFLKEIPILDLNGKLMKGSNDITKAYPLSDNEVLVDPYGENRLGLPKSDVFYILDLTSGHITHREKSKIECS